MTTELIALDAEQYYDGENPTINRYEKIIYDLKGRAHKDMWTANHKLASRFFGFAVDQFGKEFLQGAGECFFTPAGINHSLYIFENTKYFCLSFSKSIADILFSYFQNLRRDFSNLPPIIKLICTAFFAP